MAYDKIQIVSGDTVRFYIFTPSGRAWGEQKLSTDDPLARSGDGVYDADGNHIKELEDKISKGELIEFEESKD